MFDDDNPFTKTDDNKIGTSPFNGGSDAIKPAPRLNRPTRPVVSLPRKPDASVDNAGSNNNHAPTWASSTMRASDCPSGRLDGTPGRVTGTADNARSVTSSGQPGNCKHDAANNDYNASQHHELAIDDDLGYDVYSTTAPSHKWSLAGRVLVIIIVIVFIAGSLFASFKIGGWTRDAYYKANPVEREVIRTVINPTPMDRQSMQALLTEVKDKDAGTDDVHIASIVGVIYGESKGDPTALERTDHSTPKDCTVDETTGSSKGCSNENVRAWVHIGAHGIGILQWTGDRAVKYLDYADNAGKNWDDLGTQVSYLLEELGDASQWREPLDDAGNVGINGQAGLDRFNNAGNVGTASKSLLLGFVRPGDPNQSYWMRLRAALDAYSMLQANENNVDWKQMMKDDRQW